MGPNICCFIVKCKKRQKSLSKIEISTISIMNKVAMKAVVYFISGNQLRHIFVDIHKVPHFKNFKREAICIRVMKVVMCMAVCDLAF